MKKTSNLPTIEQAVSIKINNMNLDIPIKGAINRVSIYSLIGTLQFETQNHENISINLPDNEYYILKINSEREQYTQKIFLNNE
ncbi:MAG: hypothetical protein NTY32_10440 [Bacteroidia bacterium]|nr:hypothetical protein [Bacteroidia bacterium]